ncbi:MAG: YggS family pyridoxal phosphate-dependent enzyme [Desulfamplus sp.]|nr:YggS family pyridoxal phosphate-dependent enzyme [Desulfamplus sp.]MBF0413492.1 YggS family pyridoxal phosphate-dependent enzyme [Desulfamplus sp.]
MNDIKERLLAVKSQIVKAAQRCSRNPDEITLVAVSKKKSADTVIDAIKSGVDILGENYIQEAVDKIEAINQNYFAKHENNEKKIGINRDVIWHFIGHLQSNKAKVAVKYFDLIHTVDSLKLAREINRQAEKIGKIQNILIQINISEEETKSGVDADNTIELASSIANLKFISLRGLMGMPPFFDEPERARPYFRRIAQIRDAIKNNNIDGISMEHLSMGMSGDFEVAIEEGATMVRIGTSIFGSRA